MLVMYKQLTDHISQGFFHNKSRCMFVGEKRRSSLYSRDWLCSKILIQPRSVMKQMFRRAENRYAVELYLKSIPASSCEDGMHVPRPIFRHPPHLSLQANYFPVLLQFAPVPAEVSQIVLGACPSPRP